MAVIVSTKGKPSTKSSVNSDERPWVLKLEISPDLVFFFSDQIDHVKRSISHRGVLLTHVLGRCEWSPTKWQFKFSWEPKVPPYATPPQEIRP